VEERLFGLEPSDRHAARRALGVDDGTVVLLGVGRVVASKQFHRVVAALPGAGAVFLLIGDGPELERISTLARSLGLEDRVRIVGPRYGDDLAAAYAAADVLVSPSAYEGFGLTLVEGMAAGLAVVADAVGGVTDIVVDGETGLLLPPGDDDALRTALADLVADPDLRARMGAAGRRRAQSHFTPESFAESFTAVYERLGRR
jgi:glycosyltransferase involved in cell wall biosynthesis